MMRFALVALFLAIAGCGDDDVESGGCTSAILVHDEGYLGVAVDGPVPPPGGPVEGGIQPACNDSGPPYESDREVDVREVSGTPTDVAVYVDGEPDTIYLSERYRVFLPMPGYRRRARGQPCRIVATVIDVRAPRVSRRGREWTVSVDGRTRLEGFAGSLPYLRKGDRVAIDGVRCRGDGLIARRIALRP
jgi:hypothetical protein